MEEKDEKKLKFSAGYFFAVLLFFLLMQWIFFSGYENQEIPYSQFKTDLSKGKIEKVVVTNEQIFGVYELGEKRDELVRQKKTPWNLNRIFDSEEQGDPFYTIRIEDRNLVQALEGAEVEFRGELTNNWLSDFFLNWIVPFIFLSIIWGFIFRNMKGGNALNLDAGKSNAKIVAENPKDMVKFSDVAGIEEAKSELKEVVDFLKNPEKYSSMGARIPKGMLLVGPPGTGKTYVARAVAGEAGVPFFNISGSDFVEMFVGVGAARVRDLFKQAKEKSPCIIFIDEIDAIGKSRAGAGPGGGSNDERENTLNQLLVEMDGFSAKDTVIILAATNRPEVLDKALLRPGRFDRQIQVTLPDLPGREAILKVHSKKIKMADTVDLQDVAAQTAGFSGAELANLVNEAALQAVRKNKKEVEFRDFMDAFERMIAGLEKKNHVINKDERKVVAYHESGHAIIGHFTKGADPVRKVSIVPRSIGALGYVLQTPTEDRFLMTRQELIGKVKGLLGGRAAEDIVFNEVSTGASNDLEKVTNIVRSMVLQYGMSESAPNVSLVVPGQGQYLGQGSSQIQISDALEEKIGNEVIALVAKCYEETKQMLTDRREQLEEMAGILLEKEVLTEEDVKNILGPVDK